MSRILNIYIYIYIYIYINHWRTLYYFFLFLYQNYNSGSVKNLQMVHFVNKPALVRITLMIQFVKP